MTSSPRMTANGSLPTSVLGDQHGVSEAERLALAHVGELDHLRDLADLGELLLLAALLEKAFELDVDVEVVLDGVLAAAGDDDDVVDAGGDGFLDAVLNDRLVDEDQHLLRLRLGGGQEAGAESGGGKDGFANRGVHPCDPIAGRIGVRPSFR